MNLNKKNIPKMFDEISKSYDKLNHILSFGFDKIWRKKFVRYLPNKHYCIIADIASGTGDLLINLQYLNAEKYYIIDPSEKMLAIAETKITNAEKITAYAEQIPLNDNSIDLATISFGVRNFYNIDVSFSEIYRILKKDGIISIMEFGLPEFFLFRWGFLIYLKILVPIIGQIFSKNKTAYKYLKNSIMDFSENTDINKLLENNSFTKISQKNLCMGAVKIYTFSK